jgi:hypothetical protein
MSVSMNCGACQGLRPGAAGIPSLTGIVSPAGRAFLSSMNNLKSGYRGIQTKYLL